MIGMVHLPSMIPFNEFKKYLGPVADTLSEGEILKIREIEDQLADIVFDTWLRQRNKPKS